MGLRARALRRSAALRRIQARKSSAHDVKEVLQQRLFDGEQSASLAGTGAQNIKWGRERRRRRLAGSRLPLREECKYLEPHARHYHGTRGDLSWSGDTL